MFVYVFVWIKHKSNNIWLSLCLENRKSILQQIQIQI